MKSSRDNLLAATIAIVLAGALVVCALDLGTIVNHHSVTFAVAAVLPQLDDRLIPDPIVARDYLGVCLRTLARWDASPATGFPPPVRINRRKFRRQSQLLEFMRTGGTAPTLYKPTADSEAG